MVSLVKRGGRHREDHFSPDLHVGTYSWRIGTVWTEVEKSGWYFAGKHSAWARQFDAADFAA